MHPPHHEKIALRLSCIPDGSQSHFFFSQIGHTGGASPPLTLTLSSAVRPRFDLPRVIEATRLLFESPPRTIVFECHPQGTCLKLIKDPRVFQKEREAYEGLKDKALLVFLPIYFFCHVSMPEGGHAWNGYLMKQGQHSLRDILYKSHRLSQPQYDLMLQQLHKEKTRRPLPSEEGGVPVHFKATQSIQLSLSVAALRLLCLLHSQGWSHGDSHLGNFVYTQGHVYAIDFERTFTTQDPTQHLLDIQELFGHITGIMIHTHMPHEWDMRDIQGVYFHRHPLFGRTAPSVNDLGVRRFRLPSPLQRRLGIPARRLCLFMLPVCTCFTCPSQAMRLKGCCMCKSSFNQQSSLLFEERSEEIIGDMEAWGLCKMRASLLQTRRECMQKCLYVTNVIYPCIQDGIALLEDAKDLIKVPVKELVQNKASCYSTLRRLLYTPSLSERSMATARLICSKLHQAGHVEAARIFWLYVAWNHHEKP